MWRLNQRIFNSREYTPGSPARFKGYLWSQNERKFDADALAVKEENSGYSKLSVQCNPDSNFGVNFLTYIL